MNIHESERSFFRKIWENLVNETIGQTREVHVLILSKYEVQDNLSVLLFHGKDFHEFGTFLELVDVIEGFLLLVLRGFFDFLDV